MWVEFCIAAAVAALLLYVPGYLIFRACGFARFLAVLCAPLFSVLAYVVFGLFWDIAGVTVSWKAVVGGAFFFGCLLFAIALFLRKDPGRSRDQQCQLPQFEYRRDYALLAAYAIVGVAVATYVFLYNLDQSISFIQEYDNTFHLGAIRTFIDHGTYSILHVSRSGEGVGAFYPAAWHVLVALVTQIAGVEITTAVNAVNFVLCSLVFPLAMLAMLRFFFAKKPVIVLFGCICVLGLVDFPWHFLSFGPLYSNLLSYTFLPAAVVVFVLIVQQGIPLRSRIKYGVMLAAGACVLLAAQPNSIFTALYLLSPYCVYRICQAVQAGSIVNKKRWKALLSVGFIACVFIVWTACFLSPYFQNGILSVPWNSFTSLRQAVVNVILFSPISDAGAAQLLPAILIVLGILYACKHREYLWMVASYSVMAFVYVLSAATDGALKLYFAGFWYADTYRIAANLAIFAIPLICMGMYVLAKGVKAVFHHFADPEFYKQKAGGMATAIVLVLFAACNYYPSFFAAGFGYVDTAFGMYASKFSEANSQTAVNVYDSDEQDFVEQVIDYLPEDTKVLNSPNDGSAFAYGLNGLHVYYTTLQNFEENTKVLRDSLCNVASDKEVQDVLRENNLEYVLILDYGGQEADDRRWLWFYNKDEWAGFNEITDNTPGFEAVLSEGDMRLYRLVY